MQLPTISVSLDKRYKIKSGEHTGKYHAKIWVTFIEYVNGKKKWKPVAYETNVFATDEEFSIITAKDKPRNPEFLKARKILRDLEMKASDLIEKYEPYDQKHFELYFLTNTSPESLKGQFEIKKNELLASKKFGSFDFYRLALQSIIEFSHEDISFQEIDVEWLNDYQEWALKKGNTLTTVGMYLRCLRHVFNRAIQMRIISNLLYPFGRGKFIIPEGGVEVKNYLDVEQKNLFVEYRDDNETVNEYHDYALFSYYGSGMNMSDVLRMKKHELKEDHIAKERQKTKGRKKVIKKLIIPIHPVMKEIIRRRGNKTLDPNDYVFPILNKNMTEEQIHKKIKWFIGRLNKRIKYIFKKLGIKEKPSSYTLRHTYSHMMLEMGASTEELQDNLGHGNIKTTEAYKHGFSLKKKLKYSSGL